MTLIAGIDPGLSKMGVALYDLDSRRIVGLMALEVSVRSLEDRARLMAGHLYSVFADQCLDAIAVEWQQERGPNDRAPANDIINLCGFAGLALGAATAGRGSPRLFLPTPVEWKGSVPKHIKHNQIVQQAGEGEVREALEAWDCPCPANLGNFTRTFTGRASEPLDALGLALWAAERVRLTRRYGTTRS